MARTKASVGAKIASGKSNKARCSAAPTPSSGGSAGSSEKSSKSYSGGNPVCPRETPKWQKPITRFFYGAPSTVSSEDENSAGPSKRKTKSIDNNDQEKVLNDSIEINDEQTTKPRKSRVILSDDEDLRETVKSKRKNIIQSDDEEEIADKNSQSDDKVLDDNKNDQSDVPKNQVLDETIILEPLTGEDSHKIDEYYLYKNKGKGKKTVSNKENIDINKSNVKRCLEEVDDTERATKKVKVASVA